MIRVVARCVSCGGEAIREEPGLVRGIKHRDNCPSLPVLWKLSNTELWQFYIRMNHVAKHADGGVAEDALMIKKDIIRDIKRRRMHA